MPKYNFSEMATLPDGSKVMRPSGENNAEEIPATFGFIFAVAIHENAYIRGESVDGFTVGRLQLMAQLGGEYELSNDEMAVLQKIAEAWKPKDDFRSYTLLMDWCKGKKTIL